MTPASNSTEPRECAKHGPYEAKVAEILGRRILSPCPACLADEKAREERRDQQAKAEAQARRIEGLFQRSGIPLRFQSRTFEGYEAKGEGQERALRITRAYADEWATMRERGTCLILSGKPGTGKTHLACAIAGHVIRQGHSALFTTVSDALRAIKRSYDKDSSTSEGDAINDLVGPALLILDEVGMAYDTDHSKTLIFDLMNKRYENLKPTIILTNLDASALREQLGDRITDRLREGGGKLVSFNWESHRA
jgi:DNA replication protein DnaC